MKTLDATKPIVRQATARIPHEFKAIAEDAAILVLIVIAASGADGVAERLLGEHMSPVIEGLLTASLYVMCAIYGINVLSTLSRLIVGQMPARMTRDRQAVALERSMDPQRVAGTAERALLSVLVVDDDRLASTAIKYVLTPDDRIGSVCTTGSPDAAIARIMSGPETEAPDVILLDVNYTGCDKTGLDYLPALHEAAPRSKLVVMSVCREYARSAVEHDADGFIWKNESAVDFAEAVVGAAHDSFVTSRSVSRDLLGAD